MNRALSLLLAMLLVLTAATTMAQDVIEMRHTHYNLNVRAGPGLGYSIIGSIDSCDWLHVVREVDRWYQVQYDEGSGFVAGWYTAVGNPHCANQPEQNIPGSSSGGAPAPVEAAETPEPAPGDLSNFTDNMCFRGWGLRRRQHARKPVHVAHRLVRGDHPAWRRPVDAGAVPDRPWLAAGQSIRRRQRWRRQFKQLADDSGGSGGLG